MAYLGPELVADERTEMQIQAETWLDLVRRSERRPRQNAAGRGGFRENRLTERCKEAAESPTAVERPDEGL